MKIQVTHRSPNGKIIAMFERVYGYDITIVPLSERRTCIHTHKHAGRYLEEQRLASVLEMAFKRLEMAPKSTSSSLIMLRNNDTINDF